MKPRIYKKLCRQAVVVLVHGFGFSQDNFIDDNFGIPYVFINGCYEPFEYSSLKALLEMMVVQDLDCDVYSLKPNARLLDE